MSTWATEVPSRFTPKRVEKKRVMPARGICQLCKNHAPGSRRQCVRCNKLVGPGCNPEHWRLLATCRSQSALVSDNARYMHSRTSSFVSFRFHRFVSIVSIVSFRFVSNVSFRFVSCRHFVSCRRISCLPRSKHIGPSKFRLSAMCGVQCQYSGLPCRHGA